MKPAPFAYHRAESVDHACSLLVEHGEDARLLAGGQSLIAMMNLRLARPAVLIDVGRLPLDEMTIAGDTVRIGAMTRHRQLLDHPPLKASAPIFAEAVRYIAHPTIRNLGTAGGSVAHADPTAEIPALLVLLDGEVETTSPEGTRRIAATQLFRGAFTTSLNPAEMITALHFRIPARPAGGCFLELAERDGDYALAAAGAVIQRRGPTITGAQLVLTGAESVPVRAGAIETLLVGSTPTEELLRAVAARIAEDFSAYGDIRASADYRRHLLAELGRRVISTAYERAGTAT
jgi:carbon-monoxide dehydrogenase medium subunit